MENFKQIAEDCLAGKLSGTFVLRNGKVFHSKTHLSATSLYVLPYCIAGWHYSVAGNCYYKGLSVRDNDVIAFIPDIMENFKEIAEKCLAGELSGRFVCRDGLHISSFTLSRTDNPSYPYKLHRVGELTIDGLVSNKYSHNDIIQFIPYDEMKPEQIRIDIPESKVPVMEQTEKGVVITWKEKELTYDEIESKLHCRIPSCGFLPNTTSIPFYKKVEVLRKLTNIRNYFGKPDSMSEGWCIAYSKHYNTFGVNYINDADMWFRGVIFKEGEHAEQAIKMLGDELKYLFEPW